MAMAVSFELQRRLAPMECQQECVSVYDKRHEQWRVSWL